MYPINLSKKAIADIPRLKKENAKYPTKLWELILDIFNTPFDGKGQPEPLKGDLSGWWSRRITQKHRLIYKVEEDNLIIASCYGHYGDK
jgi:toxin YoeB